MFALCRRPQASLLVNRLLLPVPVLGRVQVLLLKLLAGTCLRRAAPQGHMLSVRVAHGLSCSLTTRNLVEHRVRLLLRRRGVPLKRCSCLLTDLGE